MQLYLAALKNALQGRTAEIRDDCRLVASFLCDLRGYTERLPRSNARMAAGKMGRDIAVAPDHSCGYNYIALPRDAKLAMHLL